MFDFSLNDRGEIEMAGIGEATEAFVRDECYPDLEQVMLDARNEAGDYTREGLEHVKVAVEHERIRLWHSTSKSDPPDTELGRRLQREMDAPSVMANKAVRKIAKRILGSKKGEGGKVQ